MIAIYKQLILKSIKPLISTKTNNNLVLSSYYHKSQFVQGFEEFFDIKKPNEPVIVGRGWTAPDLRRKSFEDLQKLWYVLYKEKNLLLSEKEKRRRMVRPTTRDDEARYISVKRSMAAIKFVLSERKKIDLLIKKDKEEHLTDKAVKDNEVIN
eukprot:gene19538-25436_t